MPIEIKVTLDSVADIVRASNIFNQLVANIAQEQEAWHGVAQQQQPQQTVAEVFAEGPLEEEEPTGVKEDENTPSKTKVRTGRPRKKTAKQETKEAMAAPVSETMPGAEANDLLSALEKTATTTHAPTIVDRLRGAAELIDEIPLITPAQTATVSGDRDLDALLRKASESTEPASATAQPSSEDLFAAFRALNKERGFFWTREVTKKHRIQSLSELTPDMLREIVENPDRYNPPQAV